MALLQEETINSKEASEYKRKKRNKYMLPKVSGRNYIATRLLNLSTFSIKEDVSWLKSII